MRLLNQKNLVLGACLLALMSATQVYASTTKGIYGDASCEGTDYDAFIADTDTCQVTVYIRKEWQDTVGGVMQLYVDSAGNVHRCDIPGNRKATSLITSTDDDQTYNGSKLIRKEITVAGCSNANTEIWVPYDNYYYYANHLSAGNKYCLHRTSCKGEDVISMDDYRDTDQKLPS